jgi:hypothetical protein
MKNTKQLNPLSLKGIFASSNKFITLYEMQKFFGGRYFVAGQAIQNILSAKDKTKLSQLHQFRKSDFQFVELMKKHACDDGLETVEQQVDAMLYDYNNPVHFTYEQYYKHMDILFACIHHDLNKAYFMRFTSEERHYYYGTNKNGFSEIALEIFPQLRNDVISAGECFGASCYTGCVFHIMRIMEIGVQRLGRALKIPKYESNGTLKDWGKILADADPIILKMNSKTSRRRKRASFYANLVSHLQNVRMERNNMVHAKVTYTKTYNDREAEDIYNEARQFINKYADFLETK